MVTFICACVWYWGPAQDWVQLVSMMAFLSTLVTLLLHLMNLISRFPGPWILIVSTPTHTDKHAQCFSLVESGISIFLCLISLLRPPDCWLLHLELPRLIQTDSIQYYTIRCKPPPPHFKLKKVGNKSFSNTARN